MSYAKPAVITPMKPPSVLLSQIELSCDVCVSKRSANSCTETESSTSAPPIADTHAMYAAHKTHLSAAYLSLIHI